MLAAIKGHTDMIPHLLREANLISKNGKTALIYALDCKRADCVKILVEYERASSKISDLMIAAYQGDMKTIHLLLNEQKQLVDRVGRTALHYAAANNQLEALKVLIKHEARMKDNFGMTALVIAVVNNSLSCIPLLITAEAGMQNKNGETAFSIAA